MASQPLTPAVPVSDVYAVARKVYCSDASESGIGVCSRCLESREVGEMGRCKEAWRFKARSTISARRSALGIAAEVPEDEFLSADFPGVASDLQKFSEIPQAHLDASAWDLLHSNRLKRHEHITKSEGRALVWSVCHASRFQRPPPQKKRPFTWWTTSFCASPPPKAGAAVQI